MVLVLIWAYTHVGSIIPSLDLSVHIFRVGAGGLQVPEPCGTDTLEQSASLHTCPPGPESQVRVSGALKR